MSCRLSHLFLLIFLLLPLHGAPPGSSLPAETSLPTVVYISLPACISAVLENPELAERLFQAYSYPRNAFLAHLEKEIEKELKASGNKEATEALKQRKRQNLVSKVEYLYLKANTDPLLMKAFLLLNGLSGDLAARANDNVYEILSSRLWMPDQALEKKALRQRPETRIKNSIIQLLIRIQLNLAAALCETAPDTAEAKTVALIELSNIAALPPPEPEVDGKTVSEPIPGNIVPVYQETSFPILDLYTSLFHLTDWSSF